MDGEFIYLDYSSTTKADRSVLDRFSFLAENYSANPNSNHSFGIEVKGIVEDAIKNIGDYFGVCYDEIIFTSGASESNNLAIKGIAQNSGRKRIITTQLEHSSVFGPIGYLQKSGYKVDFVCLNTDGTVNIEHLKSLVSGDVLLVSIGAVDPETGIRQPIEKIGLILKEKEGTYFHSDITQCLGKVPVDLANVDFASFSGHKIYCFKGIGGLIKKRDIKITPLIHGGKSTTIYRSGTPQTELIGSLARSFDLFKTTLDEKYEYVSGLNKRLRDELLKYEDTAVNSSEQAIPHILNVSVAGRKADDTQKFFTSNGIFISTKTACASDADLSKSVMAITGDEKRAASSVRISLSYKTTEVELEKFIEIFRQYIGIRK